MMIKKFACGPLQTNAIIVACTHTKKAALFDAPPGAFDQVYQYIHQEKLSLIGVYLTHSHWDHIADCFLFQKKKIPIFVHPDDAKNLEHPGSDNVPSFISVEPAFPNGFVVDEMIFHIGGIEIKVIHTPGHSPGAVCYYCAQEKLLISGDTLFEKTIGRIDLPTSEPHKMANSIKKLAQLPKDTRVIPGHGPETTLENEQWIQDIERYLL